MLSIRERTEHSFAPGHHSSQSEAGANSAGAKNRVACRPSLAWSRVESTWIDASINAVHSLFSLEASCSCTQAAKDSNIKHILCCLHRPSPAPTVINCTRQYSHGPFFRRLHLLAWLVSFLINLLRLQKSATLLAPKKKKSPFIKLLRNKPHLAHHGSRASTTDASVPKG